MTKKEWKNILISALIAVVILLGAKALSNPDSSIPQFKILADCSVVHPQMKLEYAKIVNNCVNSNPNNVKSCFTRHAAYLCPGAVYFKVPDSEEYYQCDKAPAFLNQELINGCKARNKAMIESFKHQRKLLIP